MKTPAMLQYVCAALLCWATQGHRLAAESQLQLEVGNVDWRGGARVGYDVFDPGEYLQTIYFKVRLTGDPCLFFVTFSTGAQGEGRRQAAFASDNLEYRIYDSVNRRTTMKDLPAANANEVIRGAFAPGETVKELTYAIVVPPRQVKLSGRYTDPLKITVYQGTPENFVEKDSRGVHFSVRVEEVTEMSLINPGTTFDPKAKAQKLEFDRLAQGKAKGFDLRVRSNAGYQVLVESENGGVMKSIDPSLPSTIPYFLKVGGTPVNLSGGRKTALVRNNRLTDHNGDRHEVSVTMGEIGNAIAGTYRDHLIVTVISDN